MNPLKAQEIVNKYIKSRKLLKPDCIVQLVSDLPCSPGKIRYAFLILGENAVKQGVLEWGVADRLATMYSQISTFYVEDPDPTNKKYKKYMKELKKGNITKNFKLTDIIAPVNMSIEYHNFLADCQGNYKNINKNE